MNAPEGFVLVPMTEGRGAGGEAARMRMRQFYQDAATALERSAQWANIGSLEEAKEWLKCARSAIDALETGMTKPADAAPATPAAAPSFPVPTR